MKWAIRIILWLSYLNFNFSVGFFFLGSLRYLSFYMSHWSYLINNILQINCWCCDILMRCVLKKGRRKETQDGLNGSLGANLSTRQRKRREEEGQGEDDGGLVFIIFWSGFLDSWSVLYWSSSSPPPPPAFVLHSIHVVSCQRWWRRLAA